MALIHYSLSYSQSATGGRGCGSLTGLNNKISRVYRLPIASQRRPSGVDKTLKTQIKYYSMSRTIDAQNTKTNTKETQPKKKSNNFGIWIVVIIGITGFIGSLNQPHKTDREIIVECAQNCTVEQFVQLKRSIEDDAQDSQANSEFMGRILEEAQKPAEDNQVANQ